MATSTEFLFKLIQFSYRNGFASVKFLEETIFTSFAGLTLKLFCPFFESFNEKVGQLMANGMIQHWFSIHLNPKGTKRGEEEFLSKALTMDDLGVGFQVCLIPLSLSIFVFFLELLYSRLTIVLSDLKEKFVAMNVIEIFMEISIKRRIM